MARRTRVLVVDDSALVRRILTDAISSAPDLEVAGTAPDPEVAWKLVQELKPDVLTLDIEMPKMDGITFLRKLMLTHPIATVIISSLAQSGCRAALDALEAGAVDVVGKPGRLMSTDDLVTTLPVKIRAAAQARVGRSPARSPQSHRPRSVPVDRQPGFPEVVIGIGASTGGTEAVRRVLQDMPADSPPVLIVQHIPPVFSKAFAQRLDQVCAMQVREAEDGEPVCPGVVLVAPGDLHLTVVELRRGLFVRLTQSDKVCYQRPSVDVLFQSMASLRRSRCVGAILTGMGSDGADGLLQLRKTGARTLAQDEATSVVYGMPRQATLAGAVERSLPLGSIARALSSMATSN